MSRGGGSCLYTSCHVVLRQKGMRYTILVPLRAQKKGECTSREACENYSRLLRIFCPADAHGSSPRGASMESLAHPGSGGLRLRGGPRGGQGRVPAQQDGWSRVWLTASPLPLGAVLPHGIRQVHDAKCQSQQLVHSQDLNSANSGDRVMCPRPHGPAQAASSSRCWRSPRSAGSRRRAPAGPRAGSAVAPKVVFPSRRSKPRLPLAPRGATFCAGPALYSSRPVETGLYCIMCGKASTCNRF